MVYSAEIRWFFEAKSEVVAIEKWFNTQHQFFTGKWGRADIYLWQAGLRSHSVKIREGKLEVKILQADRGAIAVGATNSGNSNDWVKYSFGLKETDEENQALLRQFSQSTTAAKEILWLRVEKERLLIKFSLDPPENNLTVIPEEAWPAEGCSVELTKIKINRREYYTFGLEAFSKTQHEKQNLERVLNQIIPALNVTNLHHHLSHSYPSFLATLYPAS